MRFLDAGETILTERFVATPVERSDSMTYSQDSAECPDTAPDVARRMARYGIIRVPVDYFHLGEFRYSNLEDAIAEARRQQLVENGREAAGRP
jgi:hypothetical protein